MTSANLFHRCIKAGNGMPFILSCFDKCLCHCKTVAVFSWASCDNYDFFAHKIFLRFYWISFFCCLYRNYIKNDFKYKYAHLSAILTL